MSTSKPQDIKTLSFRITRKLWLRIGNAARRLNQSTQAFCTEAIERHLEFVKQNGNGTSEETGTARKAVERLRKPNTQE